MNAVEIEEAVSALAEKPFDPAEFPYAFLEAFGRKETTLKRLRSGDMNKSDVGGVLQRDNIHIAVAPAGEVGRVMTALRDSPATARWKAKYIVATDGETFEAEELGAVEAPIVCPFKDFPDHFGFFLPLAGISTVKQIRESAFDIKATGRLNRLYVELLKTNPDWDTDARREDMNHFMARLIFCFFAEDTGIFIGNGLFTDTVAQMSAKDASMVHEVISTIFTAMNTKTTARAAKSLPRWADTFPYVNGGLFSGSTEVPVFSKVARSYLLNVGALEWKRINPDIFGSMIQAVADDEERGALGMHYTSVPNILKVLNPLFLDDLREKLAEASDNPRKLLNLRNRMARIRVFDPACGSGNFLVIAYKEMRAIEAEINRRRGEADRASDIPKTNFRGIELRSFPAEIARLALIIAEYQADVLYRGPKMALAEFLPLDSENWITCGNALRLDWLSICPPTGTGVKFHADDLFARPLEQAQIDFENEGGETYICGNPPYLGKGKVNTAQKLDMNTILNPYISNYGYIDYVACWFFKAALFFSYGHGNAVFVATNSICQGRQAAQIWSELEKIGFHIRFAHTSFLWSNNAQNKAAVYCVIVAISNEKGKQKYIYTNDDRRAVDYISPYLIPNIEVQVVPSTRPISNQLGTMSLGNKANDGGYLTLTADEYQTLKINKPEAIRFLKRYIGSKEFANSIPRYCLWIDDATLNEALKVDFILQRLTQVRNAREQSPDAANRKLANLPHRFREMNRGKKTSIVVPIMNSVRRHYIPSGLVDNEFILSGQVFGIYDGEYWNLSILLSRLHFNWIATIGGRLKEDYRYSNDLGWNTFPVPTLTEKNKADLTRCAEDILLAREAYFPATIADMYDPDRMDTEFPLVRAAHERNDEVLERIYIGRRFKNDTERLEKLFEMYTKMTATPEAKSKPTKAKAST